ncbi:DUF4445 domain-containing protein [Candidatus Sumerlaeota bacterium]|nr:DUF4445 domain-containing protein [Candidatus Sumerlaeota bacterium]
MTKRYKLFILPDHHEIEFTAGKTLKKILDRAGIFLTYPCGGRGDCGKCLVHILNPMPVEPTEAEKRFIPEDKLEQGYRLACQYVPHSDTKIAIPPATREEAANILIESRVARRIRFAPAVRKVYLTELVPADIEHQICDTELVSRHLDTDQWSLSAMQKLPLTLRRSNYNVTATLYKDLILDIEPGDTSQRVYGVAVDVGTTTIASALLDLRNDAVLARRTCLNPQRRLGADVISRISAIVDAMNRNGRVEDAQQMVSEFQQLVVSSIQELINTMCTENNISPQEVYEISCAGNTVMSHLLLGINPEYLGLAPFVGVFRQMQSVRATQLGFQIHPEGVVTVLPNIGGFVGGDIVADMLIAGMDLLKKPAMLIDIGTNGEVVVKDKDGLLRATSAAAGPAFEGAQISQGVQAASGAIDRVFISDNGQWEISTITGEPPIGICGSGLVSAVAELRKAGFINSNGRILNPEEISPDAPARLFLERCVTKNQQKAILLAGAQENAPEPIYITQYDIRELQLAKGAIATAQEILLKIAGLKPEEIDTLFIAGAFGNYISPEDAVRIGLVLPSIPLERIKFIGNAALAGASLVLRSTRCRKIAQKIASATKFVELANRPDFQDTFIMNTRLP